MGDKTPEPDETIGKGTKSPAAAGPEATAPLGPAAETVTQASEATRERPSPIVDDGLSGDVPRSRYLGGHELLEKIDEGGMGVVWKARQVAPNRLVALKLIRNAGLASLGDLRRFRVEAEAIAALDHPHIVPIHDLGQEDGLPYFSMKLLTGGTLKGRVDQLKGDPRAAAAIMAKVARAVHHAHQRAILHRDLKPSNVLFDEQGEPYVTDFGLAKRIDAAGASEQTGEFAIMGTAAYMPPEQARGEARSLTTAADVYALGATLYEVLAGQPPFVAASVPAVLRMVVEEQPARPRARNAAIDRDLEAITLKALEKRPKDRYESAERLAIDLENWLARRPVDAQAVTWWRRVRLWARRRPDVAAFSAALVLLFLVGLGLVLWQWTSALAANEALRRSLFASDMKLAEQAYANGQVPRVEEFVARHERDRDLLGFEWYYLRALSDPERQDIDVGRDILNYHTVSPDGTTWVAGGSEGVIRLWDVATNAPMRSWSAGSGEISHLDFDPTGKVLASAGHAGRAVLWDFASGKELRVFEPGAGPVLCVAISPDGRRLLAASRDLTVTAYDIASGSELWRAPPPTSRVQPDLDFVNNVQYSPSGKHVVANIGTDQQQGARVLDAETGQFMRFIPCMVRVPRFGPDGFLYVSGVGGFVQAWDIDTGAMVHQFEFPGLVNDLAISPRGDLIVAMVESGRRLAIWDMKRDRWTRTLDLGPQGEATIVCFTPDGRRVATSWMSGRFTVWSNLRAEKVRARSLGKSRLSALDLDVTGRYLSVGDHDGTVHLWDTRADREVGRLSGHEGPVYAVAFDPLGRWVASAGADGTPRVWKVETGEEIVTLDRLDGQALSLAFDPRGERLAVGGDDRSIRVYSTATWRVASSMSDAHDGPVQGLAFRGDGRELATASADRSVKLWDPILGRCRATFRGETAETYFDVAYDPGGTRVVAASSEGGAAVWDVGSRRPGLALRGHEGPVYRARFSPDGRRVITAGADRAVKLWDPILGVEVLELRGEAPISAARFTPDGLGVWAASWDGQITFWDAAPFRESPAT